jgi:exodeoxyribonuclease VII small subunit
MQDFDYQKAVAELEEIARKVEDPSSGLEDIDRYVKQSENLVARCRAYLRTVRDKVDSAFEGE